MRKEVMCLYETGFKIWSLPALSKEENFCLYHRLDHGSDRLQICLDMDYNFWRKKIVCSRKFIGSLVSEYGKHVVYTDGGTY